jgi:hypothetical protein
VTFRDLRGHSLALLTCAALALLFGEIAGAILFYRQQGRLIYSNQRVHVGAKTDDSAPIARQRLHPYLGFAGPYSVDSEGWRFNNLGFVQTTPYKVPFEPSPRDLIVVVFGGSVASNLVTPWQGGLSLSAVLQEQMPDRNIVVYSMAQGAGKQPQQLIALAMLLALGQHIDVIVNLDGFNEFALGYSNARYLTHPIFPALTVLWGIGKGLEPGGGNSDFHRIAADLIEARSAIKDEEDAANGSRSGTAYIFHKLKVSSALGTKARAEQAYVASVKSSSPEELRSIQTMMGINLPYRNQATPWEDIFQIWLRSSDAMAALSRAAGAQLLHIIQPNQYFSKKQFSPDEARVALSQPEDDPMRVGAERVYPMIAERADLLQARGIISAINLFDGEPGAMYVDNCCHYTRAGETKLARFVVAKIMERLSTEPQMRRSE